MHICKRWRPNCSDILSVNEDLCLNCTGKDASDERCQSRDCRKDSKDVSFDICANWEPDCTKTEYANELECYDCDGKEHDTPECLRRVCTRNASDVNDKICKHFVPNCTLKKHELEDICLQCRGKHKKFWRCKEKKWDCKKLHANEAICYYSTTTTTDKPMQFDAEDLEQAELSAYNDPNPHLNIHVRRPDYFTSITVPTFMCKYRINWKTCLKRKD